MHRVGQMQYQKGSEAPDVAGLPGIHIECKNVERLNLRKAMEQSSEDAINEGAGINLLFLFAQIFGKQNPYTHGLNGCPLCANLH